MLLRSPQFAENLKRLRLAAGLKQGRLAAKMQVPRSGLSSSAYSKIELGERNMKVSDLVALQRIYGVEYSEFFQGIEPGQ